MNNKVILNGVKGVIVNYLEEEHPLALVKFEDQDNEVLVNIESLEMETNKNV